MVKRSGFMVAAMLVLIAAVAGCSKSENTHKEADFVGVWQSSRVTTPIHLYEDGEWELKTESGEVQQYGVWQYSGNRILWTVRVDDRIRHDPNPVLSVTPGEFQLRESDGSVTTFRRL